MVQKRGQITIFIIIGIIALFLIGTVVYMTGRETTTKLEAVRPTVEKIPQQIQPVRDLVDTCIKQLAQTGLEKIGATGGYIDDNVILTNSMSPTEGEGIQLAENTPPIAYWWYMSSSNKCKQDCQFNTKRPGLYRTDFGINIESQLDGYISGNLKECLAGFSEIKTCTIEELSEPQITTNVAQEDIFFVGKYKLRANCENQMFDIEDYYVTIDLNMKEIYELATNMTNMEAQNYVLEQVTKTIIDVSSDVDAKKLPPSQGAIEIGAFLTPKFWILYEIEKELKQLLTTYIPLIQTQGTRNYRYITAPTGTRDTKMYEVLYDRHFFLPMGENHDTLELRFNYNENWKPYFDLGCNGQICTSDSADVMIPPLFISIHRYNFPYDLSYPVVMEIRNPDAFNQQGYSFRIALEQNLRNSEPFNGTKPSFETIKTDMMPSMFCNPNQRTSGEAQFTITDSLKRTPVDATITYMCADQYCVIGETKNGKLNTKMPRCLGGILRVVKQGYQTHSIPFDITDATPFNYSIYLNPKTKLNVKVRNYAMMKQEKFGDWSLQDGPPISPTQGQETTIQLKRNGKIYDEQYFAMTQIKGNEEQTIELIPGEYTVMINSFLRQNITFNPDERCQKYLANTQKECFMVPEEAVIFDEEKPFPYGNTEYNWTLTTEMMQGKKNIEFRQVIMNINGIPEEQRIIEDIGQIGKVEMYTQANMNRIQPVLT